MQHACPHRNALFTLGFDFVSCSPPEPNNTSMRVYDENVLQLRYRYSIFDGAFSYLFDSIMFVVSKVSCCVLNDCTYIGHEGTWVRGHLGTPFTFFCVEKHPICAVRYETTWQLRNCRSLRGASVWVPQRCPVIH